MPAVGALAGVSWGIVGSKPTSMSGGGVGASRGYVDVSEDPGAPQDLEQNLKAGQQTGCPCMQVKSTVKYSKTVLHFKRQYFGGFQPLLECFKGLLWVDSTRSVLIVTCVHNHNELLHPGKTSCDITSVTVPARAPARGGWLCTSRMCFQGTTEL